ncbi:dynein axonemal heavy chain 7-like [Bacillus rossius redtenbacheri]|uniref:dynein axonemal heavy chain 7-like n=1 Tax=Bacillus rossius redtenbacheri TaxID=93214 RepID=UPI002FDDEF64
MFVKCDQKSLLPKPHERRRVKCFYNCLAVVMAHHLQSLCFRSIEDYTSLICDPEVSPSFLLHLFYEEEEGFVFKPGFRQFDDVILGLFDDIVRACGDIPRVEGQLYLDSAAPEVLKPIIPVETVNRAKRRVLVELYVQRDGPRDLLRDFYPFLYLVDGTAGGGVPRRGGASRRRAGQRGGADGAHRVRARRAGHEDARGGGARRRLPAVLPVPGGAAPRPAARAGPGGLQVGADLAAPHGRGSGAAPPHGGAQDAGAGRVLLRLAPGPRVLARLPSLQ